MAVFVSNTTAWNLKEKTAQTTNVVTWPDLRKKFFEKSFYTIVKGKFLNAKRLEFLKSIHSSQIWLTKTDDLIIMAVLVSNTTAWNLKEKTAQTTNVVTWPDLRTSHGRLVWNFLSWGWILAGIIPFWMMLFILPGH